MNDKRRALERELQWCYYSPSTFLASFQTRPLRSFDKHVRMHICIKNHRSSGVRSNHRSFIATVLFRMVRNCRITPASGNFIDWPWRLNAGSKIWVVRLQGCVKRSYLGNRWIVSYVTLEVWLSVSVGAWTRSFVSPVYSYKALFCKWWWTFFKRI